MICEYFHHEADLQARIKKLERDGIVIQSVLRPNPGDEGYHLIYKHKASLQAQKK